MVGERLPRFDRLLPFLVDEETRLVAFGFVPELLEVDGLDWTPDPKDHLCDRGDLSLRGRKFLFPAKSHA